MTILTLGLQAGMAQERPLKIVTNHPDFKIKISRCVAIDKNVFIDLLLSNEGNDDIEAIELWACSTMESIATYDNEGNTYGCYSNFVKLANSNNYSNHGTGLFKLLEGVPTRLSIRIDGVSTSAESIARIDLPFICPTWGLTSQKPVKILNIPITRE
jgi:hypothetical protein